jgi:hypothetical protein
LQAYKSRSRRKYPKKLVFSLNAFPVDSAARIFEGQGFLERNSQQRLKRGHGYLTIEAENKLIRPGIINQ